jgi:uncharacterized protein YfaS (alpha-2-macroglobulin family)
MRLKKFTLLTAMLLLGSVFYFSCSSKKVTEKPVEIKTPDPAFATYIAAYTSGVVSNESTIRVLLANDHDKPIDSSKPIEGKLFSFSPSIKGEAYWIDKRTIEFVPAKAMPSGKQYAVAFNLTKLVDVPDDFKKFEFSFRTMRQHFDVFVDGLSSYDNNKPQRQRLDGRVVLADRADTAKVEKLLTAYQGKNELKILWSHTGGKVHRFMVENVKRREKAGEVKLAWNGSPLGVKKKDKELVEVPALGDFKVTDVKMNHSPEQFLTIHFSDPIKPDQNLTGIVSIDDVYNISYVIDGHTVSVYPPFRLSGIKNLEISRGIKNFQGYKMGETETIEVEFEEIKPDVKLIGSGTIVPNTNGLLFPFEAVNLKAVDVHVTKIFESNVQQFLQINSLHGSSNMKRVAKNILKKRIYLNEDATLNLHEWNRFSLNLEDIIKVEPGAIYNIELRYKKAYSVYTCGDSEEPETELEELTVAVEEDWNEDDWGSYYSYYNDYDREYWSYDDYTYRERQNPCENSYYRRKAVNRNVLASDIGIIAKAGADKQVHVVLNNIKSTDPLVGATVEFYDYQQQMIGSTRTDGKGMATASLKTKPFLLVAKYGTQRGYLKMRDGESQSMSKFDVAGARVQKGIKGFIYGERGVWRPGDSLFLSFIMEDKEQLLPSSHPVSMELLNPQGQVIQRMVRTRSVNGFYDFKTTTNAEDPTGNWMARVNVGNRVFTKNLKIETVKPNRLKIYIDFGKEKLSKLDHENIANLSVKWLHGAIAKNLRTKVDVTINQMRTKFDKFKDYNFDDPSRSFHVEDETIFDGKINEEGNAEFSAELSVGDAAPGMLKANFVTKVFEEGGSFSIDRYSIPYSPYTSYVGVKVPKGKMYGGTLETDNDHTVDIATVDANGKPVSRKNIQVKVYKISWRWWWDSYDNDIASYISRSSTIPVLNTKVSTGSDGKGTFNLRVDRPSWGRFFVQTKDPESGHVSGQVVYIDWPYWARSNRKDSENSTMLSFSSDKETYETGETVKLSIPSSGKGRALVCVESGTKILRKYWVEVEEGETKYEFKTTADMAPNVYVHVTMLQPHSATENDLPIRLFGVIPISVENPNSHLEPVITMPEVLRPETTAAINVKEKDGKAMTYTLAIVDEGLLDLTSFKTPEPWKHFYAREALGVKTWDVYDDVMGAYGAELDKLLAIGGDGEGKKKGAQRANRFKPMVRYIGPFKLAKGKSARHKVAIPNYVGSVRVMVVAGQDEAYGHSEKTVPVRNPLMVLATLPRVLGPTETVQLPVNVFAMEKHVKNVTIEVETDGMFTFNGSNKKTMRFDKIGDEVVNFELNVANKLGIGKVKVVAKSGSETARDEIEIDIRTPNPRVSDVLEAVIEPGKAWNPDFTFNGIEGTNKATLEVSSLPPIDLGRRLKYLIRYPHGCIEQTTSSVFPQMFVSNVMEVDNNYKIEIANNVNAGLKRLQLFQTVNGGFSYWPGDPDDSEWGSNYAGHFILEAEALGYRLPSGLKKRWIKYQSKMAKEWRKSRSSSHHYYASNNELNQAYRLYTLALAKSPELGAMNRMREQPGLSFTAKWRLAAAYQLVGQPEVSRKLISGLATSVSPYRELSYTYGSDARDEAMILETLSLLKEKSKAGSLAKRLAEKMSDENRWMSTQTTAYSLIAMSKFIGSSGTSKIMKFNYTVNGSGNVTKSTMIPIYSANLDITDARKASQVAMKNNGSGMLYARLTIEGIPVAGDQSEAASNLNISVSYKDMSGNTIDPGVMEQGTDFVAEVTVSNPGTKGYLSEMALNQIFPSGWEIHNSRMDEFASANAGNTPTYQDIRDDRVYTYYNLGRSESKTFKIRLNATYLGRFYLPTVMSEAMYDNTINARTPGKWVTVVKPGGTNL